MGLRLDGHHRCVVDLRLGDLRNRNIWMQLLKALSVRLQVLLGLAVVLALAVLAITLLAGQLPRLNVGERPLQLVLLQHQTEVSHT